MQFLKYIFWLNIVVTLGCVDIAPLPSFNADEKMFVMCELDVGKRIVAKIYYTGDVNGKKIRHLNADDLEYFSLVEGDKDWGYPFEYDRVDSVFYIEADNFEIKSDLTYRFMGVGQSAKGGDPEIQIPLPISLDTFIINKLELSINQGKYKTDLNCSLEISEEINENSFFYIIPKSDDGGVWEVDHFYNNVSAFNRLSHKPGFLIDYSLAGSNNIKLQLSISELDTTSNITFEIYHVTESFYRYNLYTSNIVSGGNSLSINPPIAGFNIQTDKAIGTFSAKIGINKTYSIR